MEIFNDVNDDQLENDDLNNWFTLTQSKNEDGLTFTECANESRVYNYYSYIFYLCYTFSLDNLNCYF